ncbi:MAG TPA: WbuC family cupin fold metalloprotein [Candidatus Methylacidiphilales bacterium]
MSASDPKPFPLAFPAPVGDLFVLDEETLRMGVEGSRTSPRKRIVFPLHRTQDALVQRILNFMQPGTYARPHLHPRPDAVETVTVLRGTVDFFRFDDAGKVLDRVTLRSCGLIDIEPNVWHTFIALSPDTVVLEAKRGPYDAVVDKTFADWSPAEDAGPETIGPWMERLRLARVTAESGAWA